MASGKEQKNEAAMQNLKAALKTGDFAKLYFFFGEETYLKEYYFSALKKKLLGGAMEEFNYRRIPAEEMSMEVLRLAVEAMPMLADRVLVRVDDYDPFRAAEEERKQFTMLISDLPSSCCLVFYYDTISFSRDGKMEKLNAALRDFGQTVEFVRPSSRELGEWVSRHFRSEGKSIRPDLCQYLIFLTGGGMYALEGEIRKLAAYCAGQEIRKEDIDAVTEPTITAAAFDVIDALGAGDGDTALRQMHAMLRTPEDAIAVLGTVGSHFRKLLAAKTVRAAGGGAAQLMETIGTNSDYYAKKLLRQADGLDEAFLRQSVLDCYETDRALKSFGQDGVMLLEVLLMKLAGRGRT